MPYCSDLTATIYCNRDAATAVFIQFTVAYFGHKSLFISYQADL